MSFFCQYSPTPICVQPPPSDVMSQCATKAATGSLPSGSIVTSPSVSEGSRLCASWHEVGGAPIGGAPPVVVVPPAVWVPPLAGTAPASPPASELGDVPPALALPAWGVVSPGSPAPAAALTEPELTSQSPPSALHSGAALNGVPQLDRTASVSRPAKLASLLRDQRS